MNYDLSQTMFKFNQETYVSSHGMTVFTKESIKNKDRSILPLMYGVNRTTEYPDYIILGTAELEMTEDELKANCILNDRPESRFIKQVLKNGGTFEIGFYGNKVKYSSDRKEVKSLDLKYISILPPEYIGPPIPYIDADGNIMPDNAVNY